MTSLTERIREGVRRRATPLVTAAITAFYRRLYVAAGAENRPATFDVATTVPALLEVQKNYPVIRAEVEALLGSGVTIPRYHEVDPGQVQISAGDKKWKVFVLDLVGARPRTALELCPKTSAILDRVPNLFQAFFSILEAGKSIPAHDGPFYGAVRYHLGLIVPTENPPSKVGLRTTAASLGMLRNATQISTSLIASKPSSSAIGHGSDSDSSWWLSRHGSST